MERRPGGGGGDGGRGGDGASSSGVILERGVRLSRSRLWSIDRAFYEARGADAWRQGTVPHYITSNPFIARCYADVIAGFARDVWNVGGDGSVGGDGTSVGRSGTTVGRDGTTVGRDGASANNAARPLWIVELGAGSGRFSYHLLRELPRLRAALPAGAPAIRYLLTDLAERNLAVFRSHPQLRRWIDDGVLEVARLDLATDEPLRTSSGEPIEPGALVVIANYVLDSLPTDLFFLRDGALYESLVTLAGDPRVDPEDPAMFSRLGGSFHQARVAAEGYYDDPICNRILADYAARPGGPFVMMPSVGLALCARLRALAGERLLVLCADKGDLGADAVRRARPPGISLHGSVSVEVNFHALGEWFAAAGGAMLRPPCEAHSLTVAAFTLGACAAPGSHTRRAWDDGIARFGPDDLFSLSEPLAKAAETLAVDTIAALLRLSLAEPRLVLGFLPTLARRALDGALDEETRRELARLIQEAAGHYFHLGEPEDFLFHAGVALLDLGEPAAALACLERSRELYPDNPNAADKLAECRARLERA
jgi:hypothetical protein